MTAVREDIVRELERIVDRLGSMPLTRAHECEARVHSTAEAIVDLTAERSSRELPHLKAHALGPMVAVVGRDYLDIPGNDERDQQVLDLLIALRRALP
ncbi:MAG: hypothetical protein ORN20_05745 [Candidatus Nanopelagicales bacterium]|nr:hypothetical protein [Candidatus Nanopelagicales bacterium]